MLTKKTADIPGGMGIVNLDAGSKFRVQVVDVDQDGKAEVKFKSVTHKMTRHKT